MAFPRQIHPDWAPRTSQRNDSIPSNLVNHEFIGVTHWGELELPCESKHDLKAATTLESPLQWTPTHKSHLSGTSCVTYIQLDPLQMLLSPVIIIISAALGREACGPCKFQELPETAKFPLLPEPRQNVFDSSSSAEASSPESPITNQGAG